MKVPSLYDLKQKQSPHHAENLLFYRHLMIVPVGIVVGMIVGGVVVMILNHHPQRPPPSETISMLLWHPTLEEATVLLRFC